MVVQIKTPKGEIVKTIDVIDYFILMLNLQRLAQKELKFDRETPYYIISSEQANGKLYEDGVDWE